MTVALPAVSRPVVVVDTGSKIVSEILARYAAALQRQAFEHMFPSWGFGCLVRAATGDRPPEPLERQIRLASVKDAGALGEHLVTDTGDPYALVDPDLCHQYGVELSSCISHELLEFLVDGPGNLCCQIDGDIYDMEVADRVEADSYLIDGVPVSNFNLPACFSPPQDTAGAKYDFLGLSTVHNEVRPGGYRQRFDPQQGWAVEGQMRPYRAALAELGLSRGARRRLGHRLGHAA